MGTGLTRILAIALVLIALAPLLRWPEYRVESNPRYGVAGPMVKAALKFHGIRSATIDEFGFGFFMRDGKRCRLFNAKFMRKWRGDEFKKYNRRMAHR